jgi:group II intron reverse transcriptase/maturase
MQTSLQGIAKKAESQPDYRFRNLYGMLNEAFLLDCWRHIRKNAAYGVDRVSAGEYGKDLRRNVGDLVERLKRKRYRAKLVRRHYIPKGGGKMRPLGIPAVEDKLLQLGVARLLSAIYEQDFLRTSFGYRPGRGAHDAVHQLTIKLQFGRYQHVVEADIQDYFGSIDHEWLIRMLEQRIDDGALLWLIRKWLKAGVLDTDGRVLHPAISPVLANVYLHYVLDLWFERAVKRRCRGEACLIRYADDFVCAFEYVHEADSFFQELGPRLRKFGLELSSEKTRTLSFSGQGPDSGQASFDFLGFEFRWGLDRRGHRHLKRRTARPKLQASLKRFTAWCRESRHQRVSLLFRTLNRKLRGYNNYYGIADNSQRLGQFHYAAMRILHKWLNRRSQRRSYNWAGFQMLLQHFEVEQPRIVHRTLRRTTSVA